MSQSILAMPEPSSSLGVLRPAPPTRHKPGRGVKADENIGWRKTYTIGLDLFEGLCKSKITRGIFFTAVVVTLACVLLSNPIGWVATAFSISTLAATILFAGGVAGVFGVSLLAQRLVFAGTLEMEVSTLNRLTKQRDYDEITIPNRKNGAIGRLFLGSMPNRLRFSKGEHDLRGQGKSAVLSITEEWERKPLGLSIPYTEQDWNSIGVKHYKHIDALDHKELGPKEMDEAAEWIHARLKEGNVYVHCRAGVGRSATAIAAYLMKYGKDAAGRPLTIAAICSRIKHDRTHSTIWNKLVALAKYDDVLKKENIPRPQRSPEIETAIKKLRKGAKKLSKKDIAPLLTIRAPDRLP